MAVSSMLLLGFRVSEIFDQTVAAILGSADWI
jgi:hypothetical protein